MKLPKPEEIKKDEKDFVEFWSKKYEAGKYTDEEYYAPFLNMQKDLTEEAIDKLFEWKTGGWKTPPYKKLDIVKDRLEELNELRHSDYLSRENMDEIKKWWEWTDNFWPSGYVWDIFLLHVARPDVFAIFDERTFQAWKYIEGKDYSEIWRCELDGYLDYCDLVFGMCERTGKSPRDVDRAMFSFGGFLGTALGEKTLNKK